MRVKTIILLHITFFIFLSCDGKTDLSIDPKTVKAALVTVREYPDEAGGFGNLSFISKVDITSPQESVIKRIYFREGDFVRQGQLIILLENPQINLAVERAQNNFSQAMAALNIVNSRLLEGMFQAEAQLLSLEKAEAELAFAVKKWEENNRKHINQEVLYDAGGIHTEAILVSRFSINSEWEQIQLMEREIAIRRIGCRDQDLERAGIKVPLNETERKNALVFLMTASLRAEVDAACAVLEAAEKELASANIALSQLNVHSPASGIVGARYSEEGERVRPQDKILSLIDTDSLYAIFPVREKDALRIEKGMAASVLIDGTGETKNGIVDLVYPQADSQSLSFLVRILLLSDAEKLKPGMFARVTVLLGPPKKSLYIPESSVFNAGNNEGNVFVIKGSAVSERKVFLGSVYGEDREITGGLNEGEIVVLRPDYDLKEGTSVTVIN